MAGYEKPESAYRGFSGNKPARNSLAVALRKDFSDEWISSWLREVIEGRDPNTKRDADGKALGGLTTTPDWQLRMRAMAMMLQRRDGMPAQHIQLEQEVRAMTAVVGQSISGDALKRLPPEQLNEARALLRSILSGEPRPGAAPDLEPVPVGVIDASSTER
jgi:hypothetical protein